MSSRSKKKARARSAVHTSCPIPNTHRRLESTHRLWHEALANYDDPDGFRTFLNSTIQELRNVTFVLKKERSKFPGFDAWYAPWQERLRANADSRWVVDNRNVVVKEGDLNAASRVQVRFFIGFQEVRTPVVFEGPATASTEDVAYALAKTAPAEVRKDAFLVVERRWEVEDLPGRELLDVLASAYGSLADLVKSAHLSAGGQGCGAIDCDDRGSFSESFLAGRPRCMAVSEDARTATVDLTSNSLRVLKTTYVKRATKDQQAVQRYAKSFPINKWKQMVGAPLTEQARVMHDAARTFLETDGSVLQFTYLLREGKVVDAMGVAPQELADLPLVMMRIRKAVERTAADALLMNGEIWWSDGKSGLRPTFDPDRREAVQTVAVDRAGTRYCLMSEIDRAGGRPVLRPVVEIENPSWASLEQVFEFWRTSAK